MPEATMAQVDMTRLQGLADSERLESPGLESPSLRRFLRLQHHTAAVAGPHNQHGQSTDESDGA